MFKVGSVLLSSLVVAGGIFLAGPSAAAAEPSCRALPAPAASLIGATDATARFRMGDDDPQ